MKRLFTFLTIFLVTCAASLQAATITPGVNQKWWGYMGNATNGKLIGIGEADTYHCAIFLPGDHDMILGKTLCAVRITLLAEHASNVKLWIATELPASDPDANNTLWMTDVTITDPDGIEDVALDTPYAITASGVYVGYTFTITSASTQYDQYPVVTTGTDLPNGLLMRTSKVMKNWTDQNGQGFGVLAMKVLLEGTFADYVVSPVTMQNTYYAEVGQSASVNVVLTNNGQVPVNNISYTVSADGVTGEEQTVTLGSPLGVYERAGITVEVAADAVAGSTTRTLTVTKVNSNANQSPKASTQFTFNTLEQFIKRNVVVEEFTGTGCGYCPRGLVGMEKLRQTFGERFIGIGIHQYNETDAMYIANYPDLNFMGAPACRIDRGEEIDPYYGSENDICDDFRAAMSLPAMVKVDVMGVANEAMTEVEATALIEPLNDTNDYKLELALVADGLSGTTSAWWQSNYYSAQPSSQEPEDLRIFCSGGKYGSNSVKGFSFNDVAIGTSFVRGVNQLEPLGSLAGGLTREVHYTLSLPTKATLRNALKKATIYVVALVVDGEGRIANAAKREVGDVSGIVPVQSHTEMSTPFSYSLDGTLLVSPQWGVNIVRMSDGTVRKVVVK